MLAVNISEQCASPTFLRPMYASSLEVEPGSFRVTVCLSGRRIRENIINTRMVDGTTMTYRAQPDEAEVAVSYQCSPCFQIQPSRGFFEGGAGA